MKTDTQLQEGRHLAIYLYPSFRWPDDIGDYLEQGALSRAVVANYADEIDVISPRVVILQRVNVSKRLGLQFRKILKDRRPFSMRDSEGLPRVLHFTLIQITSANLAPVFERSSPAGEWHSRYGQV
jgi:hypothetical protein